MKRKKSGKETEVQIKDKKESAEESDDKKWHKDILKQKSLYHPFE